ncbi:MAG: pentapeptide repeat-containing protein [Alphaproteobacteria bacterium]|nr:pentapeptide repeat-containing protein [Alphaproteobacteria bacterium]
MDEDTQAREATGPRPGKRSALAALSSTGVGMLVFVLGVVTGFPLATAGADVVAQNLGMVLTALLGLLVALVVVIITIVVFRNRIWTGLFRRGEFEIEKFAGPLADVARFAARQQVEEATGAARNLAELVLARYAWVSTRRWMVATVTGFIAAIAALAGSALLFQQNQLLRVQSGLMADQTDRLGEQNQMIEYQIELGEAARSAALLPEILDIGALIGGEVATSSGLVSIADLSASLQARIVAATNAARPYRYLRSPLAGLEEDQIAMVALLRRKDLPVSKIFADQLSARGVDVAALESGASGVLSDRPVSPERGQLIGLLFQARLFDTEQISIAGADFSYAEVRVPVLGLMSFRHAQLAFGDFSRIAVNQVNFGGANMENTRFIGAMLTKVDFGAVSGEEAHPLYRGLDQWTTRLSGTDFRRATLVDTSFDAAKGFGMNFDGALLHQTSFIGAEIAGATFKDAVLGKVDFNGANLSSVDFDGVIAFDADFLKHTEAVALADSFKPERYVVEAIDATERDAHPMNINYHLIGDLGTQQAYRIRRTAPFSE